MRRKPFFVCPSLERFLSRRIHPGFDRELVGVRPVQFKTGFGPIGSRSTRAGSTRARELSQRF